MSSRLIGLIILVIGLAAFGYLWRLGSRGAASANCPTATGTVLDSRVDMRFRTGGGDSANRESYLGLVRYRYSVAGQDYESSNRRYPNPGYAMNESEAAAVVARYSVGSVVRVYYNPAKPAEACLETGEHWTAWAGKAIALVIAAAGAMMLLRG
jgi:hypothetical protein